MPPDASDAPDPSRPARPRRRPAPAPDPELPLGSPPGPRPEDPDPAAHPDPPASRRRASAEYGPPVDLFTPRPSPAPPAPAPVPAAATAAVPVALPFEPDAAAPVPVQRVRPDSLLGGGSRPDPYLYLVADRAEAERLLRSGLFPDPGEPPRLLERRGVPAVLAALEEDGTGTGGTVVLRVRRLAVADLLEDDPGRGGASGYLFSGRPGGRG